MKVIKQMAFWCKVWPLLYTFHTNWQFLFYPWLLLSKCCIRKLQNIRPIIQKSFSVVWHGIETKISGPVHIPRINFIHNVSIYSPKNDIHECLLSGIIGCMNSSTSGSHCHFFKMRTSSPDHTRQVASVYILVLYRWRLLLKFWLKRAPYQLIGLF